MVRTIERPGLAKAPRDFGLPRHRAQRVEIRVNGEVDVPLLATDDRGVPEVCAHDRGAERDALLAHVGEVADRDVLPPRHAVEIGVEQPHGAHTEAAHRSRRGLGLLVVTHSHASFWVRGARGRAGV